MDQLRERLVILNKSLISISNNLAELAKALPINVLEPKLTRIEWHLAQIQEEIDIDVHLKGTSQGNANPLIQECFDKRAIVLLERLPWSSLIKIKSETRNTGSDQDMPDCLAEMELDLDHQLNELEEDPLADLPLDTNEPENPVTPQPDNEAPFQAPPSIASEDESQVQASQAPPKRKSKYNLRKIRKTQTYKSIRKAKAPKVKPPPQPKAPKLPPEPKMKNPQVLAKPNSEYFICQVEGCTGTFPNSRLIAIEFHKLTHRIPSLVNDDKNRYCSICNIFMASDPRSHSRYRNHILKHHGLSIIRKIIECSYPGCDKKFRDIYHKRGHAKVHYQPQISADPKVKRKRKKPKTPHHKPHQCHKCPMSFVSFESYEKHVQGHEMIICEYCGKEISGLDLKQHIYDTHRRKCGVDGCTLEFATAQDLRDHWEASHVPQFQCDQCPKSFYNRRTFQAHTAQIHIGFICSFEGCGKNCLAKSLLIKHEKAHQKEIEKQERLRNSKETTYACPLCGKLYTNTASLAYHKSCVHEESYNFKCSWPGCEKKFKTEGRLKMHVVYHQEEMSVCEYCQKDFPSEKAMKEHAGKEHRKELDLPFKCPKGGCGMSYARRRFLNLHLEKDHKESIDESSN